MELDDLKLEWKTIKTISTNDESLLLMLQENKHPVLKGMRNQIKIEVTAWTLFFLCYYSMFDGGTKPIWVNLFLIISVLGTIGHSLYGYHYNKYQTNGMDVKSALEVLYNRLKKYAWFTLIVRANFILGLLVFFTYGIHFTTIKYLLLGFICIVFLYQLFALYQLWNRRMQQILGLIESFNDVR